MHRSTRVTAHFDGALRRLRSGGLAFCDQLEQTSLLPLPGLAALPDAEMTHDCSLTGNEGRQSVSVLVERCCVLIERRRLLIKHHRVSIQHHRVLIEDRRMPIQNRRVPIQRP